MLQEFLNFLKKTPQKDSLPPLAYLIAENEIGQKEVSGSKHNDRILEYHSATALKAQTDEVPWCSAFVNWCLKQANVKGTNQANARSFLAWGLQIQLEDARKGDIVIFKRGSSAWAGHVGFFAGINGEKIIVLGGNQKNQVNFSEYSQELLLGVRRYG